MSKAHVWNLLFENGRGRFEMNLKTRKDTKQVKSHQTLQLCWTSLPLYNRPTYTLKEPKLDTVDFFTPIYLASFVSKLNDDHHTVNVICIYSLCDGVWFFGQHFGPTPLIPMMELHVTPKFVDDCYHGAWFCWYPKTNVCSNQSIISHIMYVWILNVHQFLWLLEKLKFCGPTFDQIMAIFPVPNLSHSRQPGCLAGVPSDRQSMGSQLAWPEISSLPNPEGHPVKQVYFWGKGKFSPYHTDGSDKFRKWRFMELILIT